MTLTEALAEYPSARIEETKARLRAYWQGEEIGRPAVVTTLSAPQYRQVRDAETMVSHAIAVLAAEARLPGDNVPAFMPDLGPVTLASAFGGRLRYEENGPPWIDPLIHDAAEVDSLRMPSPDDGLVGEAFLRVRLFRELCGGKIHVRPPDWQGPLNVAGLVWEPESFLMAMHTNPDAVHRLLKLVTDFEIEVLRAFQREFGEDLIHPPWPHFWMPPEFGIGMTEDLIPLLSARAYREFGLPYTCRIAREFGGVHVHCCGECEHHLPALAEIPNLRGLDFAYPHTRPEGVREVLGDGRVFSMGLSSRGAPMFPDSLDFLRYARRQYEDGLRLVFFLSADDPARLRRQMEVLGIVDAWDMPGRWDE